MTQEELYWFEKRLREKADAKEKKIRDKYDEKIKISQRIIQDQPNSRLMPIPPHILRHMRDEEIKRARLEVLEPILDEDDKVILQELRDAEKKEKELEQQRIEEKKKKEEEKRKREDEELRRKEEERKRREVEEMRLASIREKEAIERRKKEELEEQERQRKEQEKKKRIKTALLWLLGIVISGCIVTAIFIF